MATLAKWYLTHGDGQLHGPYTTAEMAEFQQQGYVTDGTLCWAEGREQWQCAEFIAELTAAFGAAQHKEDKGQKQINPSVAGGDELSAFKQEIAAIDAKAAEAIATEEAAGPSTDTKQENSFVDDDGTLYVWDAAVGRYAAQAAGESGQGASTDGQHKRKAKYDLDQMTFEPEEETIPSLEAAKRSVEASRMDLDEDYEGEDKVAGKQNGHDKTDKAEAQGVKEKKQKKAPDPTNPARRTTSVYLTGLPDDVTITEIATVFSKCGLIKEDEDGQPKIKIYRDKKTGMVKGDGLVTYLRRPSVDLAVQILDGSYFRAGMGQTMTVAEAKFEQKADYVPKQAPKKGKNKKSKGGAQQDRRLGWGGFDDKLPHNKVTVILKNMFQPHELLEDAELKAELKADVEGDCKKLGEVDRVMVYEHNPEGVVAVRFVSEESADKCVQLMDGRYFGGRKLSAEKWDGFTKFYVKPPKADAAVEEAARLEKFAEDLEKA